MTSCFCQLVPLSHVLGMQHEISKTTQPGPTGCNWLDVVKTSYLRCNCRRGCFLRNQALGSSQWSILSLVLLVCTPALQRCRPREHSDEFPFAPSLNPRTKLKLKHRDSPSKVFGIKPCKGLGIFVKWFFCPRSLPQPALSVSCDPFIWFQQQCYIDQRQGASHQTTRL